MLKKLAIVTKNLFVCYLKVEVNYTKQLLISKVKFIRIEFKIPNEGTST